MNSIFYLLLKSGIIVLLLIHLLFSLVVVRQTKLMIKVVEAKISPSIYAISLVHMGVSLFVLVWTILFI